MSDEPKYCVGCKHYFPGTSVDCRAPGNKRISLVTGDEVVAMQARVARDCDVIGCGVSGKWWEARQ